MINNKRKNMSVEEIFIDINTKIAGGQEMSTKDMFAKEFLNNLPIFSDVEWEGFKVPIVVLPEGTALEKVKTGGGACAQPFYSFNDYARIIVNPELFQLPTEEFNEIMTHELGHIVSLTDGFTKEFDSTEFELLDPQEVKNLLSWADKQADFWDKVSPVCKREQITLFLEKLEADQSTAADWFLPYNNCREFAANYFLVKTKKSLSFLTVLAEVAGHIGLIMAKAVLPEWDYTEEDEKECIEVGRKNYEPIFKVHQSFLD